MLYTKSIELQNTHQIPNNED